MKIEYQRHTTRRKKIMEKWLRITTDYMGGMTAIEIAKRYKVSRAHVYYILSKMKKMEVS